MSKYKKNQKSATGGWGYLLIFLAALILVLGLFAGRVIRQRENTPTTVPTDIATGSFVPVETEPTVKIEDLEEVTSDAYKGLQVVKVGSYTGLYVEDGSNDVLSRLLMIVVENTGTKTVQYAEIELSDGEKTAHFSLTTLPPGESVVLLEKDRMLYADGKDLSEVTISNVAIFQQEPTLCEDLLAIQALDGALNVTNISGKDIEGDIVIYYKNAASDLLYGGITYRVTIKGGLAKDAIQQITASHFTTKGSRVMWVTVN